MEGKRMYDFAVNPSEYRFQDGAIYIGDDDQGDALGMAISRHCITIGSPRSGKGVGCINTNLRTWKQNALVIDPKGEAATVSWKARAAMGQAVHVLDPFGVAKVPQRLRASYNPLADLDENSPSLREDIINIADGLVMRSGAESAKYWENGSVRIIAALIAYVVLYLPKEEQNLITVQRILLDTAEGGLLKMVTETMSQHTGKLDRMMISGVATIEAEEAKYFISNAQGEMDFLASDEVGDCLAESSFSMRDLKLKKTSVFVVLPFDKLDQSKHGRFLRLLVRCGIAAMQKHTPDGEEMGERCLFILDEFFALGKISEIAVSCGAMPSSGLHLWPFLHNIEQLSDLYGQKGMGAFLGTADLQQFFAITDPASCDYVSNKIGVFNVDDLPDEPRYQLNPNKMKGWDADMKAANEKVDYWTKAAQAQSDLMLDDIKNGRRGMWRKADWRERDHAEHQKELAQIHRNRLITRRQIAQANADIEYNDRLSRFKTDASRMLGKPRLAAEQIANLVRLEVGEPTAKKQIAFVGGGRPLICNLGRYFEWEEVEYDHEKEEAFWKEIERLEEKMRASSDPAKPVLIHGAGGTVEAVYGDGRREFFDSMNDYNADRKGRETVSATASGLGMAEKYFDEVFPSHRRH